MKEDVVTIKGPVGQPDPKVLMIVPITPAPPPNNADNHIIVLKECVQYRALTGGIMIKADIRITPTA